MAARKKGKLFVISSPSGGGKTSLAKALLKALRGISRSVSMTTRNPRRGERDGRDYYFASLDQFSIIRKKRGFLEYAKVFDQYYGTPRSYVTQKLAEGKDVLLLIDVQGARQIKKRLPKAVLIFVMPPSLEELERRLVGRKTDSRTQITSRLKIAQAEMDQAHLYDYVVVNEVFGKAVSDLKSIITSERARV